MKVVINTCYGGFGLSDTAWDLYKAKTGTELKCSWQIKRDDPVMIEIVECLGGEANSSVGRNLKIVEIPDDVEWEIQEYDGREWVAEKHRTWS